MQWGRVFSRKLHGYQDRNILLGINDATIARYAGFKSIQIRRVT